MTFRPPHPKLWAYGQHDDFVRGSHGAAVDASGVTLYRYDGSAWERVGTGRWNAERGRIEDVRPTGNVPPDVVVGLSRAVVRHPAAREALKTYLGSVIAARAFSGRRTTPVTLDDGPGVAFGAVALARCMAQDAARRRRGTKAASEAAARARHARAVARAALANVCGRGVRSIQRGSRCDITLDALSDASPDTPCVVVAPTCDRVVTAAKLAEWRNGAMPTVGPYETAKPHAAGADPCCYYAPATQERLALRRKVERDLRADPGSIEWVLAVLAEEAVHPLAETWARCDDVMRARVAGGAASASGHGSAGTMRLVKRFYDAARAGDTDAARSVHYALDRDVGVGVAFDDFVALDAPFFDFAHREAHDSRNIGWIRWIHETMRRHKRAIHHKSRGR